MFVIGLLTMLNERFNEHMRQPQSLICDYTRTH